MKFILFLLFVPVSHWAFAQVSSSDTLKLSDDSIFHEKKLRIDSIKSGVYSRLDSLSIPGDSTTRAAIQKADSIRTRFQFGVDSLQGAYTSSLSKIDAEKNSIQQKIDSLQNLNLPTDKLTSKLDSITQLRPKELEKVTQKMETLKSKASKELGEVNIPPQLQEPMSKLKQSIQGYPLPGLDGKMPDFDLPQLSFQGSGYQLPSVNGLGAKGQFSLSDKMPKLNQAVQTTGQLKDITGKVGEYGQEIKNVSKQVEELKDIDKATQTQLTKLEEVHGVDKEMAGFEQLTGMSGMDEEAMKQKLKQAATEEVLNTLEEQAADHFAGKEQAIKNVMKHVSKLKSKYSEVKSLSELPKRAPNPMRGKPLIERIVPGLTFLIQKKDVLLWDVNPVARFRFTGRFTAGLGWNQRIAFDKWNLTNRSLIYGPRAMVEYKWAKGFRFLFSPELLKTSIPPQLQRTPIESNKVWVAGMFGGLKKEFTVYKKIQGNTELLYNLYKTHGRSPYADRFVVRFGFEFPMKKKSMRKVQ